jgi:hypothetical protein
VVTIYGTYNAISHEKFCAFTLVRYDDDYYYYYYYYYAYCIKPSSQNFKFIACIFSESVTSECPSRAVLYKMDQWKGLSVEA